MHRQSTPNQYNQNHAYQNINIRIERWLYDFLCLDATTAEGLSKKPEFPDNCQLYFANKDTLFSYNKTSEKFMHKIWSLFVGSHYKNSPNDLQLLADAPSHFIAVLLGPLEKRSKNGPKKKVKI